MLDTAGTNDDAVLQTNHYLAQRMRKARVRVAWLEVDDFTVFGILVFQLPPTAGTLELVNRIRIFAHLPLFVLVQALHEAFDKVFMAMDDVERMQVDILRVIFPASVAEQRHQHSQALFQLHAGLQVLFAFCLSTPLR